MKAQQIFLLLTIDIFPFYGPAQTGQPSVPAVSNNEVTSNQNQTVTNTKVRGTNLSSNELSPIVVTGELNEARDQIVPYLGATRYSIGQQQIQTQSQGANAPFNQVILKAPGVAQDSFGQLHVRDEHANLQFRIDDVLIPEGITDFGSENKSFPVNSFSALTNSTSFAITTFFWIMTNGIRFPRVLPTPAKTPPCTRIFCMEAA